MATPENYKNNTYLEEYWEGIKSGEIIVGKQLKKTIRKLIKDKENERYIYNTFDADLRINMIESICLGSKNQYYGKPLKLELFQKAWITALYSFKMSKTKLRRFKRTLLLIARKCGKTELIASLLFVEFLLSGGAELAIGSCSDKTSQLLYSAFDTMRQQVDGKNKYTWKNQQCIRNQKNNAKLFKLSDKGVSNDGFSLALAVLDEVHELLLETDLPNAMVQAQSLIEEPLFIQITTNGYVDGGFLDNEIDVAMRIINGEDDSDFADSYLPWLYTQDSEEEVFAVTDEELTYCEENEKQCALHKSNPMLGKIKKYSYIKERLHEARTNKIKRASVLAKDFNIKSSGASSWLTDSEILNTETFDLEEFRGAYAIAGTDIAETTDLTSLTVMFFKPGSNKKYIHQMHWIPEAKLERNNDKAEGAKYEEWQKQGYLRIVEGNDLDPAIVADYLYELYQLYDIKFFKTGYDQKFSKQFTNRCDVIGLEYELVMQNSMTLSGPIKMLENDLIDKKLVYQDNPITKWCLSNTALKIDSYDKAIIVKKGKVRARRIDATASILDTYAIFQRHRSEILQLNGII